MRRRTVLALSGLFIVVFSLVSGCSTPLGPGLAPAPSPKSTTPVLVPRSRNLVIGTITVRPAGHYDIVFLVNVSSMRDVRVVGSFEASGALGNDIKALIMDDIAYINWVNRYSVPVLYSSGQVTIGNIDVPIMSSGRYHLVFSNEFSIFSSKSVSTEVDLEWSELRYQ